MIHALHSEESAISRMLGIIERGAPRLMRIGGCGMTLAPKERGPQRRITPEERAKIESVIRIPGITALEASAMSGFGHNTIRRQAKRMGVTLVMGARGKPLGTRAKEAAK